MNESVSVVSSGFLCSAPERTVEVVLLDGGGAYIEVRTSYDFKWRKEIPFEKAEKLLALCEREDGSFATYVPSDSDEIERKFLVDESFRKDVVRTIEIEQGYLNSHPARTVRIRVKNGKGEFTVKGLGDESGAARFEWEMDVSVDDAALLFGVCEPGVVYKLRHLAPIGDHLFEVDELLEGNEGLIFAEIEFKTHGEDFERPAWLKEEITGDSRYYNSFLAKHPFKTWDTETV